ncbi:MAG: AI-2E family transporter [Myxococcota bacterium]|nr:AI-2E family transporter [Myxococcota bacterium]
MTQRGWWILAATAATALLALIALQNVLVALAAAGLLAYLASPLLTRLETLGIPRAATAAAVLSLAAALLAALCLVLLPVIQSEILGLIQQLPSLVSRLQTDWIPWLEQRLDLSLPRTSTEALAELRSRVQGLDIRGPFSAAVGAVFRSTTSLVMVGIEILLFPVLAFYGMRDGPKLRDTLVGVLPAEVRETVLDASAQVDRVVSAWLRGQLSVCLVLAVLYSIAYSIAGVPAGILVGTLAGFLVIIPYAGPALGFGLALVLTAVQYGVDTHLAWVAGGFVIVQGLEGTLITPRIVGDRLGLHPCVVILGLIAGGQLLGFAGIVLAVPLLAVARVLVVPRIWGPQAEPLEAAPPTSQN